MVLLQENHLKDFQKHGREFRSVITKHYATTTNLVHEEILVKQSLYFDSVDEIRNLYSVNVIKDLR